MNRELVDIDKEARIAAAWWTDVLRRGAKHNDGDHDLGVIGLRALALQTIIRNEEAFGRFERRLVSVIKEEYPHATLKTVILRSDHGPVGRLWDVAKECAIDMILFPEKTIMWIGHGRVLVRYGYGAPREYLYCRVVKLWELYHELDAIEHHDWYVQHGRKEESNPIGMPEFLTIEEGEERIARLEQECLDYRAHIQTSVTVLLESQNDREAWAQYGEDIFEERQDDLKVLQGQLMFKEELLQRLKEEVAKLRGEL